MYTEERAELLMWRRSREEYPGYEAEAGLCNLTLSNTG